MKNIDSQKWLLLIHQIPQTKRPEGENMARWSHEFPSFTATTATSPYTAGLFKCFPALPKRQPCHGNGAQGIHPSNAGQFINEAGCQQNSGKDQTDPGASRVCQNGLGIQGGSHFDLEMNKCPHGPDGNQGNNDPPESGLRMVT